MPDFGIGKSDNFYPPIKLGYGDVVSSRPPKQEIKNLPLQDQIMVKLVSKGTKRAKERIKQWGENFRIKAKKDNGAILVSTLFDSWSTWVEKDDRDFSVEYPY